jgi:hypothetical protein
MDEENGAGLGRLLHVLAHADPKIIALIIGAFAIVAALAVYRAYRRLHLARIIEDTPTSKIRSAPQGYVELQGKARPMDGPPIIAPLSGLPCAWYRYRIEEQQTVQVQGRTERRWVTVDEGESTDLFWLQDSTGRVVIDPEGAEVTPRGKDTWHSRAGAVLRGQPALVAGYLASHHSVNRRRFSEWRLAPGQPLYAIGILKAVKSHVDGPTVEVEVRELLRAWKGDQDALKARFDLNHDGRIDDKEWVLVRSQARREVLRSRREEQQQFVEPINVMAHVEGDERPFLLSAYPQHHLAQRYRLGTALYLALFFLAGSAAVWVFNTRFL